MNKSQQMKRRLIRLGAIVAGILIAALGAMLVTGSLATKAETRKSSAESAKNNDTSQIAAMKTQIDQSGDAEKRFLAIGETHSSSDYSSNTDALKAWLKAMKDQYRFTNDFKLTLALDKPSDNAQLNTLSYTVTVREPMKLEFGAMSDQHVYSFLDQLQHDMPGFVRITRLEAERRTDFDTTAYREMSSGINANNVGVHLEFTWVGLAPKKKEEGAAAGTPTAEPTPSAAPVSGGSMGRPGTAGPGG